MNYFKKTTTHKNTFLPLLIVLYGLHTNVFSMTCNRVTIKQPKNFFDNTQENRLFDFLEYPVINVPEYIETNHFIVSEEEERAREEQSERLSFALAVKSYNKKEIDTTIEFLLKNAAPFLPLDAIKIVRLANRNTCSLINGILKQSVRGIIFGNRPNNFITNINDNRFFIVHIPSEKTEKNQAQLEKWGPEFINEITLDTTFIHVDIDTRKFSHIFLKKMLEACTKPEMCQKIKAVFCLISHIHPTNTKISDYINTLLQIADKKNQQETVPDFLFCFHNQNESSWYGPILENQVKEIAFPQKRYTLEAYFNGISFKQTPSLKSFVTQNNTLRELAIRPNCQDTDIILNNCLQTPQRNLTSVRICHDNTLKDPNQAALIAKLFDETLFPSLKTLSLESFLKEGDDMSPLLKNLPSKANNSIATLKLEWFFLSEPLLDYFLRNLTNLTELIIKKCVIFNVHQKILSAPIKNICALETIRIMRGDNNYNQNANLFFSIESLEHFLSLFPKLRNIYIESLFLDTENDFKKFMSYIKKLAEHTNNIYFDVLASNALMESIKNNSKKFGQDILDVKNHLKTNNIKAIFNSTFNTNNNTLLSISIINEKHKLGSL